MGLKYRAAPAEWASPRQSAHDQGFAVDLRHHAYLNRDGRASQYDFFVVMPSDSLNAGLIGQQTAAHESLSED